MSAAPAVDRVDPSLAVAGKGVTVVELHSPELGRVVSWRLDESAFAAEHERATRTMVGERLAAFKGFAFAGEYRAAGALAGPLYFVPSDTLLVDVARLHGIHGPDHLFGGVVPHAFIATKVITHGLVQHDAHRPEAWSARFGEAVASAVLKGFSAFSLDDARSAGRRLLAGGAARVKPARATGGRDQAVVTDERGLDDCLEALDRPELETHGVVLEENLAQPVVHSVGQVCVDGLVASYHGVQRETRDNRGRTAYGGSDLHVVRGGFDRLLARPLSPAVRQAVEQAWHYHAAVVDCFEGFHASRINYDVAQGMNTRGQFRSGVLEQSWRVGGATGAEIAALETFLAQPERDTVDASCFEHYGAAQPPAHATVYFLGDDPEVGPLAKFALIDSEPDADTK